MNDVVGLLEEIGPLTRVQEVPLAEHFLESVLLILGLVFDVRLFILKVEIKDLFLSWIVEPMAHHSLVLLRTGEESFVDDIDRHILRDVLMFEVHLELLEEIFCAWVCDQREFVVANKFVRQHPVRHLAAVEDLEMVASIKAILAGDNALAAKNDIQKGNVVVDFEITIIHSDDDHRNGGRIQKAENQLKVGWPRFGRNHLKVVQRVAVAATEQV